MKKIKKILLLTFVVATMIVTGAFVPQIVNPSAALSAETQKNSPLSNIAMQTTTDNQTTITEVEITNELTDKDYYAINSTETVINCPVSQNLETHFHGNPDSNEYYNYNFNKFNALFLNFKAQETTETIPSTLEFNLNFTQKNIRAKVIVVKGTITKAEQLTNRWESNLKSVEITELNNSNTYGYDVNFPSSNLYENDRFTIVLFLLNNDEENSSESIEYLESMYISNIDCAVSCNTSNFIVEVEKKSYATENKKSANINESLTINYNVVEDREVNYSYKNLQIKDIPANVKALNIELECTYGNVAFVFDEHRQQLGYKEILFFASENYGFVNNRANVNIPVIHNDQQTMNICLGILYNQNLVKTNQDVSAKIKVSYSLEHNESEFKYFINQDNDGTFYLMITGLKNANHTVINIPTSHNEIVIKEICDSAFARNKYITEVLFNKDSQLLIMGRSSFFFCENLKTIFIPSSVKEIRIGCFSHCYSLKSVNFAINSKLSYLGISVFDRCFSLEQVTIPNFLGL